MESYQRIILAVAGVVMVVGGIAWYKYSKDEALSLNPFCAVLSVFGGIVMLIATVIAPTM